MSRIPNDEPIYEDYLGHYALVKQVGRMILNCDPPYVIGVCGSWGSGKTSFLRKLWAYLNGPVNPRKKWKDRCEDWFAEDDQKYKNDIYDQIKEWELIWFNPWHHQFEQSPVVALLDQIRQHLSISKKVFGEAGRIAKITTYSALSVLAGLGKTRLKDIEEHERSYETEHFLTPLSSQQFRDCFEGAIEQAITKRGRMVIFIDDLDRCEGEIAYRLLESLKLYLNARNCVYVLGIDLKHLEETIARVLSANRDVHGHRPLAREYLDKMFQHQFLLPVPQWMEKYIQSVLDPGKFKDGEFKDLLQNRFGLNKQDWPKLRAALDENLPHNPRKVKSFISAWKLYLSVLDQQQAEDLELNWRLTLILVYLAQFEEPLFRRIEEAPGRYNDEIVKFCQTGEKKHRHFDGLELPYGKTEQKQAEETGGFDPSTPSSSTEPRTGESPAEEDKTFPSPRTFWISRLVKELENVKFFVSDSMIRNHLIHTGGVVEQPPQQDQADAGGDSSTERDVTNDNV